MSELNTTLRNMFPGKTIFAFYVRSLNVIPDEWMRELGLRLQKMGFAAIALVHHDIKGVLNFDGLSGIFYVNHEEIKYLNAITCFIITDLESSIEYPKNSKVLAIIHSSVYTRDCVAYLQGAMLVGWADGYVVGFPFEHRKKEIKALWDNFPPPFRHHRPDSDFYLMGCGYPKLCLMRNKVQERKRELESAGAKNVASGITYAPIDLNHAPQFGGNRVQKYGIRTLRFLLTNFPDTDIIFRPSPNNFHERLVAEIEEHFAGHPNFSIDRDTSYVDTFARSKLIITDFSHIVSTFSTLTCNPAISFQPWANHRIYTKPLQYSATSFTDLLTVIRHALSAKNPFEDFRALAEIQRLFAL